MIDKSVRHFLLSGVVSRKIFKCFIPDSSGGQDIEFSAKYSVVCIFNVVVAPHSNPFCQRIFLIAAVASHYSQTQ